MKDYRKGLRDGLAIGLGYLSVSFAFGVTAVHAGIPVWAVVLISMTNLTSAGQLAGVSVIAACGGLIEVALTQVVINLRYALMSLSLSQKLDSTVTAGERYAIAFGNTDEIFAVASSQPKPFTTPYYYGLMTLPWVCWSGGTFLGAVADKILPAGVLSALGVAIYGMLIAVVLPAAKKNRNVAMVALLAVAMSCAFHWLPLLSRVSGGFAIIICGIVAAGIGALVHPVEE